MSIKRSLGVFASVSASLVIAAVARADEPKTASGHATILVQSDKSWNGKAYTHYPTTAPQLTVLKLEVPPNSALPWHVHPVPNAGYVLAGQLTIEDKASGEHKTFNQGEAFTESVEDAHRGVAGKDGATLILVYSGTKGEKTSIPLKGQQSEY